MKALTTNRAVMVGAGLVSAAFFILDPLLGSLAFAIALVGAAVIGRTPSV